MKESGKNQLTTTKSTTLILGKSKSLMGITKRLIESKSKVLTKAKVNQELTSHKDITIIGNLMWEKESRKMKWDEAIEYAEKLILGGYNDWRLPTLKELVEVMESCGGLLAEHNRCGEDDDNFKKIIEKNKLNTFYQKCYKEKGFVSGYLKDPITCWSSTTQTTRTGTTGLPWTLYFYNGFCYIGFKQKTHHVRCVRSERTLDINELNYPLLNESEKYIKLYEQLKILRSKISSEKNIPEYIIISERTLRDMADRMPQTKEEMLELCGMGEIKFEKYGERFLKLLQSLKIAENNKNQ